MFLHISLHFQPEDKKPNWYDET